ncbi:hypothetical protein ACIRYZ_37125 [Kitasatospora sp. NPDC101155]|uniref:hypothetical protein n=1 Tax=Kitasatospora sp. NPDC101155 TaxID=3364097 RepID=UPI0037F52B92
MPEIVAALKTREYTPVTVPELFAQTGGMRPGAAYFHDVQDGLLGRSGGVVDGDGRSAATGQRARPFTWYPDWRRRCCGCVHILVRLT